MPSSKLIMSIAAAAAALAIGGCSSSASTTPVTPASGTPGSSPSAHASDSPAGGSGSGSGSSSRSGPAAGGTAGAVSSVTTSGFTVDISGSQKATIEETSATTYQKGASPATARAVTAGAHVLVLGTTDNTTITAAQVIVNPPAASAANPGGQVIPYAKGEQGSTQQAGQVPSDYTQGSGTIVSGTTATKATEAALAAYAGGIADRVVAIGDGDHEVHYIGVNWPHHVFVSRDYQVIGAND